MIKATELRIGNWIDIGLLRSEPFQVTGMIIRQGSELPDMEISNYNPIALTEEWLERFGFEYDEIVFSKDRVWLALGDNGFDVWLNGLSAGPTTKIEFVHQLQNLYQALTGEELVVQDVN